MSMYMQKIDKHIYIAFMCMDMYVYVWVTALLGPPRFLHPQEPDTLLSLGLRVLEFRVQG